MLAVVWPKINKGLDDRASRSARDRAAELAQRQARSALEQYQKNLDEGPRRGAAHARPGQGSAAGVAAELKTKADAELRDDAGRPAATSRVGQRAALNEIYSEASTLATSIAGKIPCSVNWVRRTNAPRGTVAQRDAAPMARARGPRPRPQRSPPPDDLRPQARTCP